MMISMWDVRAGRRRLAAAATAALVGTGLVLAPVALATPPSAVRIVASVPVTTSPLAVAVDAQRNRIYVGSVTTSAEGILRVVDGSTNRVVRTIPVGVGEIDAVATDPAADTVWAVDVNSVVHIVAAASGHVLASLATGGSEDTEAIAVDTATNIGYVANPEDNTVVVINGATGRRVTTIRLPHGSFPAAIAVNSVSDRVWVALGNGTVDLIDGHTNTLTASVTAPDPMAATGAMAFDQGTGTIYLGKINGGDRYLDVFSGPQLRFTGQIALHGTSADFMAVDPRRHTLYASSADFSNIVVVNVRTHRQTNLITPNPVTYPFAEPWGLATDPSSGRVYVDNNTGTNVFVLGRG
jgi:YVTN family beta-propeller protein